MSALSGNNRTIRQLGVTSAIGIVVANMIGTGIFTTTGLLVEDIGNAVPVLIAWVVGGIVALCGALSYAELAVNIPGNGGEYLYLSKVYHPAAGFLSGWVSLFAGFSAPIAAAAVAFGKYTNAVFPELPQTFAAVAVLVLFTALHLFNIRLGSIVQNAFTIIKVVLIVALLGAAFWLTGGVAELQFSTGDIESVVSPVFAVGLIFVMYAYSGWNATTYIAGEVKDPSKTVPLALITGTLIVVVLYAGINFVYLAAVPLPVISGKVEVAHVVASSLFGQAGANVVSVLIGLALVTSISSMIMAGSRIYQVMGKDHRFFSWLAHRTKANTPCRAILLQSAIALIMALTLTFDAILYYVGFTLSLFAGLTVFGVFLLRMKSKAGSAKKGYRTWGYPVTPLTFLLVTGWMVVYTVVQQPIESLIGVGTLGVGVVLYYFVPASWQ